MRRLLREKAAARADLPAYTDAEQAATRVMDALRRVVHALHAGTRASERAIGISGAQLFVLRQLRAGSEPRSLVDLARLTRTTPSSVSEVVARLVSRGFIAREPSARDRRRAALTLTHAGATLVEAAPETIQDRLLAGFSRLDPLSQVRLAATLEAWLAESGLADVSATFFFEPGDGTSADSTSP